MANYEDIFKKVVSHAKEYGYVFQSSEIYDGLAAAYDYGPNGIELKNNIKNYWWKSMVNMHENIVGLDSSIFMHPTTWKASGHVDAFNDPLIDNKDSKKRYRADVLIEDHITKIEAKIEKDCIKAAKRFGDAFTLSNFPAVRGALIFSFISSICFCLSKILPLVVTNSSLLKASPKRLAAFIQSFSIFASIFVI